jgi:hypothetical protein
MRLWQLLAMCTLMLVSEHVTSSSTFAICVSSSQLKLALESPLPIRFRLSPPAPHKPAVFEIEAPSQITFVLTRSKVLEDSRGVLFRVFVKAGDKDYVLVCEAATQLMNTYERLEAEIDGQGEFLWKIEIIDEDDGIPDLLTLEVWSTKRALELKNFKTYPVAMPTYWEQLASATPGSEFIGDCNPMVVPIPVRAQLQVAAKMNLPPLSLKVPISTVVQAGRNLYLKAEYDEVNSRTFKAVILAKSSLDHKFIPICKAIFSKTLSNSITATVPWDSWGLSVSWRVELFDAEAGDNASSNSTTLTVLRDSGTVSETDKPLLPESEFTCLNKFRPRSSRVISSETSPFPYAKGMALNIEFDDPSMYLSELGRNTLTKLILHTSITWRRVCFECTVFHLALINSGAHWYVLDHAIRYLKSTNEDLEFSITGKKMTSSPKVSLFSRGDTLPEFLPVEQSELMGLVCKATDPQMINQLLNFKNALGCPEQDANPDRPTVNVLISLLDNGTSCSSDTNIVACEQNNYSIELNLRDYSFSDLDGNKLFGKGERMVPLIHVLEHEMGHWIGLDHIDSEEGLMAASMENSRCLDDTTVTAFNDLMTGKIQPNRRSRAFFYEKPPLIGH